MAIGWILQQAKSNGWFYNTGFSSSPSLTHLSAYTLVGLLKIYSLKNTSIDYDGLFNLLVAAADNIVRFYFTNTNKNHRGLPGTFNSRWKNNDEWSCNTGNVQFAFFLRMLYKFKDDKDYILVADQILDKAKTVHLVDDNIRGGIFGSYPVGAEYCPYQIPNWGVKFFADALLQKITFPNELSFLS